MSIGGHLIWLKGMRGPYAEKRPLDYEQPKAGNPNPPIILKTYEIGENEFSLAIAILEQRYPPPEVPR